MHYYAIFMHSACVHVHMYMHTYALCGCTCHLRTCQYAAILVNRPSGISQAAAIAVNRTQGVKFHHCMYLCCSFGYSSTKKHYTQLVIQRYN